MKFKKKLIPILALLLCTLTVFASCGSEPKAIKIDEEKIKTSQVMTSLSIADVPVAEGYDYYKSSGDLALFYKKDDNRNTDYKVINLKTQAGVAEMTVTAEQALKSEKSIDIQDGFIVKHENKTYTLCDPNGTAIGSAKTAPEIDINDRIGIGFATVGETVYLYNASTKEPIDTITYSKLNGDKPTGARLCGEYFIETKSNTTGFVVYDKKLNYLHEYTASKANTSMYVLSNGNVLLQTVTQLPDDAEDYDYYYSGSYYGVKCALETKIVSPKDLKEKNVDFDYVIDDVDTFDDFIDDDKSMDVYKGDIDNIVTAYKIVDKQLEKNTTKLTFSNSGKVGKAVAEGYTNISSLGNGYLVGKTLNGTEVILDAKLNVVLKLDAIAKYNEKYLYTEKYLVTADAIYDYDKKELVKLAQESITYEYVMTVGNNFIFKAEDDAGRYDYYLFNGAFNKIADASDNQSFEKIDFYSVGYSEYFYMIETTGETTTTYKIFNANGAEVKSFEKSVAFKTTISHDDGSSIILIKVDGKFYTLNATK